MREEEFINELKERFIELMGFLLYPSTERVLKIPSQKKININEERINLITDFFRKNKKRVNKLASIGGIRGILSLINKMFLKFHYTYNDFKNINEEILNPLEEGGFFKHNKDFIKALETFRRLSRFRLIVYILKRNLGDSLILNMGFKIGEDIITFEEFVKDVMECNLIHLIFRDYILEEAINSLKRILGIESLKLIDKELPKYNDIVEVKLIKFNEILDKIPEIFKREGKLINSLLKDFFKMREEQEDIEEEEKAKEPEREGEGKAKGFDPEEEDYSLEELREMLESLDQRCWRAKEAIENINLKKEHKTKIKKIIRKIRNKIERWDNIIEKKYNENKDKTTEEVLEFIKESEKNINKIEILWLMKSEPKPPESPQFKDPFKLIIEGFNDLRKGLITLKEELKTPNKRISKLIQKQFKNLNKLREKVEQLRQITKRISKAELEEIRKPLRDFNQTIEEITTLLTNYRIEQEQIKNYI
jgi:hypothetical protein